MTPANDASPLTKTHPGQLNRQQLRAILLMSASWQSFDLWPVDYGYRLVRQPVFVDGHQVMEREGVPKTTIAFRAYEIPRIPLYE